jgi:hypothetical protein
LVGFEGTVTTCTSSLPSCSELGRALRNATREKLGREHQAHNNNQREILMTNADCSSVDRKFLAIFLRR